jgi:anti-anti-sigma factor
MTTNHGLGVVADVSLSIQIIHDQREARLVPIGELDVHSAITFGIAAELAITERPAHLHVDLSQVTFIDSSGVRCIDALVELARQSDVPCTVLGRDGSHAAAAPERMVIWSGTTTHTVELPD